MNSILKWIIILNSLSAVYLFEPITFITGAVGGALASILIDKFSRSKCDDVNFINGPSNLKQNLDKNIFGQDFAIKRVTNAVRSHFKNEDPKAPLVMSFHGPTGTGKSFVSKLVAESLFKSGINSKFVHHILAEKEYINNTQHSLTKFKTELSDFIVKNVGKNMIIDRFVDHFKNNKARETILLEDIANLLPIIAYNSPGGFKNSKIISKALIGFYIPFLPLERKHVKQGAEKEIRNSNIEVNNFTMESVANEMLYDWNEDYSMQEYTESSNDADFQVDTPAILKVENKSPSVLGARRCRTHGEVRGTSSIYGTNSQGRISYANQVLERGSIHNNTAEKISSEKTNKIVETVKSGN
ncbi:torsin-1A-like [Hydra vulgaris]|uniref:Torsin-1A-like n=1 Tax=Hydra vulgaris TaxID=6087 RepID=A0ABM4DI00_HYDVU